MRLRGLTPSRKAVYFEIDDVPICINDSMTILAKKPGSPLIITKSIMRGDDDGTFYESDFVMGGEHARFVGFVIYTDGFYIWHVLENKLIPIRETEGYTFIPNTQMYRIDDINKRRGRLRFKCNKVSFDISRIIYYSKHEMFITIKPMGQSIILGQISFGTGIFTKTGIELAYGQIVNDGIVVMKNYHPMLELIGGECRELEDGDYDKVGIT